LIHLNADVDTGHIKRYIFYRTVANVEVVPFIGYKKAVVCDLQLDINKQADISLVCIAK
jgi:hypothetical protein